METVIKNAAIEEKVNYKHFDVKNKSFTLIKDELDLIKINAFKIWNDTSTTAETTYNRFFTNKNVVKNEFSLNITEKRNNPHPSL